MLDKSFFEILRPPQRHDINSWAEKYATLSSETGKSLGSWRSYPYQKEIMRAMTPGLLTANGEQIWMVCFEKSARVGYTKIIGNALGYFIHEDPSSILVVQPVQDDCRGWVVEELNPLIRNTPVLADLIPTDKKTDGTNTMEHKLFPGGVISIAPAATPTSFRRITRRIIIIDETDAVKESIGKEGNFIKLAIKRADTYHDRMIVLGSTPLLDKNSHIHNYYETSDQRRYFVPCPHCGYYQFLKWAQFRWLSSDYKSVVYECENKACAKSILPSQRRDMVADGLWKPTNKKGRPGIAGFQIWAAYSDAPAAAWSNLVQEYDSCKNNPLELQTFVNTTLGEVWEDKTGQLQIEAKDILDNLDNYESSTCPKEVRLLTAAIDTQKERIEISVYGWGKLESCYFIEHVVIEGDPKDSIVWEQAEAFLKIKFPRKGKSSLPIKKVFVDSGGTATQNVYAECKRRTNWSAIKGASTVDAPYVTPTKFKLYGTKNNQRYRQTPIELIGVNKIKDELYERLLVLKNDKQRANIHFPKNFSLDQAEEILSEERITVGSYETKYRWVNKNNNKNEMLDTLVYSFAAMKSVLSKLNPVTCWDQFEPTKRKDPTKQPKQPVIEENYATSIT